MFSFLFKEGELDKEGGYSPMHEVTPKVVAMAVSTVIRTCKILLQICLFSLFMVG